MRGGRPQPVAEGGVVDVATAPAEEDGVIGLPPQPGAEGLLLNSLHFGLFGGLRLCISDGLAICVEQIDVEEEWCEDCTSQSSVAAAGVQDSTICLLNYSQLFLQPRHRGLVCALGRLPLNFAQVHPNFALSSVVLNNVAIACSSIS